MKTRPLISIDTIEIEAQGNNLRLPTHEARVVSTDGELISSSQNRYPIKSEHGRHQLHARTKHNGSTLHVEGSPYAYAYGQNIFTSPLLLPACIIALKAACKGGNIKPSREEKKRWESGEITVRRVDLAVNFKINRRFQSREVIRQIAQQFLDRGLPMGVVENSVYWKPRSGKCWAIAIYDKGAEMRRKKCFKNNVDRNEILAECDNMIRIEVRLRGSELRRLGLDNVSAWTDDTAYEVFSKFMSKLNFLTITSGVLDIDEMKKFPRRMHVAYALHKTGVRLRDVLDIRTFQRRKKEFKAMGIDAETTNRTVERDLPLKKLFGLNRACISAPDWMRTASMVPEASK